MFGWNKIIIFRFLSVLFRTERKRNIHHNCLIFWSFANQSQAKLEDVFTFFLDAFLANLSALRWSFPLSLRSRPPLRLSLSAAARRSSLSRCLSRALLAACGTSNLIRGDSIVNNSSPHTPSAVKRTTSPMEWQMRHTQNPNWLVLISTLINVPLDWSQLLPTCSTFQSETGDCWNGVCDDEIDRINTIDDVSESIIPLTLLLRTTPPFGVTFALEGLKRGSPNSVQC